MRVILRNAQNLLARVERGEHLLNRVFDEQQQNPLVHDGQQNEIEAEQVQDQPEAAVQPPQQIIENNNVAEQPQIGQLVLQICNVRRRQRQEARRQIRQELERVIADI